MQYLVTGATGDLGRALVRQIRADGHDVLGTGRDELRLAEIEALGAKTCTFEALKGILRTHAPIDRIVHAQGVAGVRMLPGEALRVNTVSAIELLELVRAHCPKTCSVVLVGSVAAWSASPGMGAYSASKAALRGLVRTAAKELAPRRINLVEPGAIRGRMHDSIIRYLTPTQLKDFEAKHALGFARPEQVAGAIMKVLELEVMTGATVPLDCGYGL